MGNLTVGLPYTDDTEPGNKTENDENKRNQKQRMVRRLGLPRLHHTEETAFQAALSMWLQCQEMLTDFMILFYCFIEQ